MRVLFSIVQYQAIDSPSTLVRGLLKDDWVVWRSSERHRISVTDWREIPTSSNPRTTD